MRCVIYSRVSTEEQSTDNQLRQLREYADRQSWNIIEEIQDVASGGKSAEERQGLKKVFTMARQRKFDVLLFWSLDRFSREGSRKTLEYLTKLDDYRVKWHSYTEEYISSLGIFSDAIISLMACLAKQERIRISERTKAGLARVKAKGKILGRPTDVIADTEQIRELRRSGHSLSEISRITGVSKTRVHRLLSA
jgi:DNA invertase Pin-like site-specific DNA recombinase